MMSHDRSLYIALDAKLIEGSFLLVLWIFSLKPALFLSEGTCSHEQIAFVL